MKISSCRRSFLLFVLSIICDANAFSSMGVTSALRSVKNHHGTTHRSIETSLKYAATVDPAPIPALDEIKRSMIQKAGDDVRIGDKRKAVSTNSPSTSGIHEIASMEDFKRVVENEEDRLVVLRFYAPWCRACKAIGPSFKKFARENGEKVKFVDAPMTAVNTEIHQSLNIRTIPFVHIYHPEVGLVEERRMARKFYNNFERVTKAYMNGSCDLLDEECADPYPNIPVEGPPQ